MIDNAAARFSRSKAVGRSKAIGRGLAKAGKALGCGLARAGKAMARKRVLVPSCIATGLGGSYAAILGLHSLLARAGSTDAWSAAIGAVATVVLVLVTAWYAYLTFSLVQAQRSSARTAGWETALRDLSLFIGKNRQAIWTASAFFPIDTSTRPPMLLDLLASRDGLAEIRRHLLSILGVLPTEFAKLTLGAVIHLVEAEEELHAISLAFLDETQLGMAEERNWTWEGARRFHEESDDEERSEPWDEMMVGKHVHRAEDSWDQLSEDVDRYLQGRS